MLESLVRQFLYYPTRLPADEPPPRYVHGAREVWLDADDGNRIHGLHWTASEGRPTILFFHGNAQSVYEWALLEPELAPLGCGLLLVDYPGYGKSSGEPAEAGLYAAGRAALAWLSAEGVAERSVVIFGKSLGGPVAAETARGRAVRGVILESTFRSVLHVARRLLPMLPLGAALQSERYDTAARLGELRAPLLVVHGTADDLIPVIEGKEIFALAPEPKELYLVEGAGHNDVSYVAGDAYGARLRRWLDAL
jgi:uncharacterized protein